MSIRIAVIDQFHPTMVETIRRALPADWILDVAVDTSREAGQTAIREASAVFTMAATMDVALLSAANRLGLIQKLGSGFDRIDLDWCRTHGVGVARLYAGNAAPVAEHTVMLMLAACRRLPVLDRKTRAGGWDKETSRAINRQMHGKTVGIVGFGAIGRAVAATLAGFGVRIVYFDPVRAQTSIEKELCAELLSLDYLLATSDIVTLHIPLSEETAGLIDGRRLSLMKPDAILVNCARGGLVDEQALAKALEGAKLFGAALDAFTSEPPIGSRLLELEQTVVTPHCAAATVDNFASLARRAVENTQRFLTSQPLPAADVIIPPILSGAGKP